MAKRAESVALERPMDWPIDRKRGPIKALAEGAEKETLTAAEQVKAGGWAFVEQPFPIMGLPAVEWVLFRGKEALEALFSG